MSGFLKPKCLWSWFRINVLFLILFLLVERSEWSLRSLIFSRPLLKWCNSLKVFRVVTFQYVSLGCQWSLEVRFYTLSSRIFKNCNGGCLQQLLSLLWSGSIPSNSWYGQYHKSQNIYKGWIDVPFKLMSIKGKFCMHSFIRFDKLRDRKTLLFDWVSTSQETLELTHYERLHWQKTILFLAW